MLRELLNSIDTRVGYRALLAPIRRRVLPDGPRWGYATAATLLWMLAVEVVTGLLLMTVYSPSLTTAWASVHYIEQLPGGAFIRGLHYFASQAIIVLFALHLVRVLLSGAFRAPRELIWITGLILLPLTIAWAVTGNPLSGSQKAYAQIEVEGNIIASTPLIGPLARTVLLGGKQVGHLTLTHLNFLHVALIPLLAGMFLALHIQQIYKHGASAYPTNGKKKKSAPYWPFQSIRNLSVFAVAFGIVALAAWHYGAPLEAPADPEFHNIPRPEWYFLSLFELRAYFSGPNEYIATVVVPTVALLVLLGMPLIDRVCPPRLSTAIRFFTVFGGLLAIGGLTGMSVQRDMHSEEFQAAKHEEQSLARRAHVLAVAKGIPPEGPISLLRNDPKTQGPILFERHCAACHSHTDADGKGIAAEESTAPNLHGFATRAWLAGWFDAEKIKSTEYFGGTEFAEGEMVGFVDDTLTDLDEDDQQALANLITALSAKAELPGQKASDEQAAEKGEIKAGIAALLETFSCIDCHKYGDDDPEAGAPDLTGYGSRDWLIGMIRDPAHSRFYGENNDRMPSFAPDRVNRENNQLDDRSLALIADWLRGDWYEPLGEATDQPHE
ncbi:MAG: cytochrome b N-terminal domain-containing protein [Planctomycetales bacterium]|nr:cytochrome b N-terminal domain-containing protein [Planctomycetales bacterium]